MTKIFGSPRRTYWCFADAAGDDHIRDIHNYGIGGIAIDLRLAWQCPKSVYIPFLRKWTDKKLVPIFEQELLAQQMFKFLLMSLLGKHANRNGFEMFGDSQSVVKALRKGTSKKPFTANLIGLNIPLSLDTNALFIHSWCDTVEMGYSGADLLSRKFRRKIFGITVLHLTSDHFRKFKEYFSRVCPSPLPPYPPSSDDPDLY